MMGIGMRTSRAAVLLASFAVVLACGEDDGFVAPPAPAELNIISGADQEGAVSFPLLQQLRVRVVSDDGEGMANVPVTWTVTAGNGSLASTTTMTNALGEAVNSWTLGPAAGPQTVTASAPGVSPVTFTATAGPAVPIILTGTAGNNQTGFALEPLARTRVQLLAAGGQLVVGAPVTWTVLTGGGSVSQSTTVTDESGQASTVWTLGPTPGTQTLEARSGNLSFVFTAVVQDPCLSTRPFARLSEPRSLDSSDCLLTSGPRAGSFVEYFTYAPTTTQAAVYTMSSTEFDTHLTLLRGNDTVAVNDDAPDAGTNSAITIFLGPGNYRFATSSAVPGQTGTYTFSQTAAPAVTNCVLPYITRGASTSQTLTTSDCLFSGYYSDEYWIYIKAGETVTITQTGAGHTNYLILFDQDFNVIEQGGSSTPGAAASITVTPEVSGFYIIDASTYNTRETGDYTLTVAP